MVHHSEKTFYLDRVSANPEQLRRRTLNAVMAAMDAKEGMLVIPKQAHQSHVCMYYTQSKNIHHVFNALELDVEHLSAQKVRDAFVQLKRPYIAKRFDVVDVDAGHPEKGFLIVFHKAHVMPQHKKIGEFLVNYHTQPEMGEASRAIFQEALLQPEAFANGAALSTTEQKNLIYDLDAKQCELFYQFSEQTQKHVGNVGKLYRAFLERAAQPDTVLKSEVRGKFSPIIKLKDDDLDILTSIAELHDIGKFRMSKRLLDGDEGIFQGSYRQVMDKISQRNAHAMGGYQIFSAFGDKGGGLLKSAAMIAGRHHMHDKMQSWEQVDDAMSVWRRKGQKLALREVFEADPYAVAVRLREQGFSVVESLDDAALKHELHRMAEENTPVLYTALFQKDVSTASYFEKIVAEKYPDGVFAAPLRISYGGIGGHAEREKSKAGWKNDGRTHVSVTPFEAKMLAVVDVYEALTARRKYQKNGECAEGAAHHIGNVTRTPAMAAHVLIHMANEGHLNPAAVFEFLDKRVYDAIEMTDKDAQDIDRIRTNLLQPSRSHHVEGVESNMYEQLRMKAAEAERRLHKEALVYFSSQESETSKGLTVC